MTKLFVYGTLKRGECNNDLLIQYGAKFVCVDKVPNHGVYGPFPIAGPAEGIDLEGEVWDHIRTELWERLDALELGYRRKETFTLAEHKVMLYVYGGALGILSKLPPWKKISTKWPTGE